MIEIRNLHFDDLQQADQILISAFEYPSSHIENLQRYLNLQPDGWLFALYNGRPVGTVGAIDYQEFAYIGMMAVHPEFQHRGIGNSLMDRLLAWIDAKQIPMALLDASPSGYPMYLQKGFVEEDGTRIFERQTPVPIRSHPDITVRPFAESDLDAVANFDRPYFGADRRRVLAAYLQAFPQRSFVTIESGQISGYLIVQESRLGPWISQDIPSAETLLAAALEFEFQGLPSVIIPMMNEEGAELLVRAGFVLNRTLQHMRRGGTGLENCRSCIFGQVSLAIG